MLPFVRRCSALFGIALSFSATSAHGQVAGSGETVVVEQRVLLTADLTPAAAKKRALENAMAEAVRRVAGVRVQSSAVSVLEERRGAILDGYFSIVQLDAAGRAVNTNILSESWETRRSPESGEELYYRLTVAVTVERERGEPDPGFVVDVTTDRSSYEVRNAAPRLNDEIVLTVRSTRAANLAVFSIADDSVTLLSPNEYSGWERLLAGQEVQVPSEEWRTRGLRFRATLPAGRENRKELLAVAALAIDPGLPPKIMSLLEFQRWLVRIPAASRSVAFVPIEVRRR